MKNQSKMTSFVPDSRRVNTNQVCFID